jgi:hypothetical protein
MIWASSGVHRNPELAILPRHLRFRLPDEQDPVANMLRSHLDHVARPLRAIEQQGQRQPRRRPDAMPGLERNLDLRPGMD